MFATKTRPIVCLPKNYLYKQLGSHLSASYLLSCAKIKLGQVS